MQLLIPWLLLTHILTKLGYLCLRVLCGFVAVFQRFPPPLPDVFEVTLPDLTERFFFFLFVYYLDSFVHIHTDISLLCFLCCS